MANSDPKKNRTIRLYCVIQPKLQLQLTLLSLSIAAIASLILGAVAYFTLSNLVNITIKFTDNPKLVEAFTSGYFPQLFIWIPLALLLFFLSNIATSVFYTHKLVGPTIAFRRHIEELTNGNYTAKTTLRKLDAFREVADDLNILSERLEEKSKG